jgi:uncharacterized damage-inducible protein DinB
MLPTKESSMQFETGNPSTRDEVRQDLARLDGEISQAFAGLPLETFLAPQGEHWSPADHLRHLVTAVRPVAMALKLPKLVLLLRFGWSGRPSRSFEEVRDIYRVALAQGGQASGRYLPSPRREGISDQEWRAKVLDRWRQAGEDLRDALPRWSEKALDRYVLPHPLLGKLTVREILFFTLYHNHHHAARVFERLGSNDSTAS